MSALVVVSTGGLTGIGRAAALAFAKDGAKVVVSGRRDAEDQALASELRAAGAEAEFSRADVRFEDDVRNLVDGAEGKLGPVTEFTAESYAAIFDANLLGTPSA